MSGKVSLKAKYGEAREWLNTHLATEHGDDCIPWPYSTSPDGYAQIKQGGKYVAVHRLVCEHFSGAPPLEATVKQSCGRRLCQNPNHLRWVEPRQSWLDRHLEAEHGDECVLWPYSSSNGYGRIGRGGRLVLVHRLVAEYFHGEPPEATETAHNCGVRLCVNPNHLRWATRSDNHADKLIHGTHNRGERHNLVKLTEDKVREIRRLYLTDGVTQRELAKQFGVSLATINHILTGRNWRHVRDS